MMYKPDAELESLVEALLDQRIGPEASERLAARLRDDPEARSFCADALRFDAAIRNELDPQEIEWVDTRRVTLSKRNGGSGLEVQRDQSVRFGNAARVAPRAEAAIRRIGGWRWWAAGMSLAALSVGGVLFFSGRNAPPAVAAPALRLLNPDFEATDLTFLAEPTNRALVDWQDYFVTENADVAEISRVTGGEVLPKSGRNVARLWNYAYLTQRLRRADASPLLAEPGLKVLVTGWAQVLGDGGTDAGQEEPFGLRGALRFVAGGSPGMVQYEAAHAVAVLEKGDWRKFRLELTLPEDLSLPPSHGAGRPKLDLTGKELTLSLDSLCRHGYVLLLDDLRIEEKR